MRKRFEDFNSSVGIDVRLYKEDIRGSIAYAKAIAKAGIIDSEESERIIGGLKRVEADIDDGKRLTGEDVHMAIEKRLVHKIGDVGKKIHTARSRNEQVAVDERLYLKGKTEAIVDLITSLQKAIVEIARKNVDVVMPGYTHLQQAQPILFSHYILSLAFMLQRDKERFSDCKKRMDVCPLGSGALAGNPYDLDRQFLARELGFSKSAENSIDAVADRDFIVEFLSCAAMLMTHLSRFSEDFILWASSEFGFLRLDDRLCSSSSLMPQKKNPDTLELVRGKTGRVFGNLFTLLTVLKGLGLAYYKDLQEDKEPLFDTIDTVSSCLGIFTDVISTLKINKQRMKDSMNSYIMATDLAYYLVEKGVPFRDGHRITGELVKYAIEKGKELTELSIEDYKSYSGEFEKDVYSVLDYDVSVKRRNLQQSVKDQIGILSAKLSKE
jgi:argininosuccinate lyase